MLYKLGDSFMLFGVFVVIFILFELSLVVIGDYVIILLFFVIYICKILFG